MSIHRHCSHVETFHFLCLWICFYYFYIEMCPLQLNAGVTQVTDAADGAADGTATVVATCNAAGTAWEVNGMAITNVECTIRTFSSFLHQYFENYSPVYFFHV